jgi:hypothetical protein
LQPTPSRLGYALDLLIRQPKATPADPGRESFVPYGTPVAGAPRGAGQAARLNQDLSTQGLIRRTRGVSAGIARSRRTTASSRAQAVAAHVLLARRVYAEKQKTEPVERFFLPTAKVVRIIVGI